VSDRTYRERAAECVKLSQIGCDTAIREGFRNLAEAYLKLANAAEHKGRQANAEVGVIFGRPTAASPGTPQWVHRFKKGTSQSWPL
jgi:hypothetical protein